MNRGFFMAGQVARKCIDNNIKLTQKNGAFRSILLVDVNLYF